MTVKELIELNQMILDVVIEVRKDGGLLIDKISIGNDVGRKPEYPTRVPIKPEYAGNNNRHYDGQYKDATYIKKSINSWDDGKDYWEIKVDRIPKRYLDLTVYSWEVWPGLCGWGSRRRYKDGSPNNNFHGQRINIVALPDGQQLPEPEPREKKPQPEEDSNQMTIDDWFRENGKEKA